MVVHMFSFTVDAAGLFQVAYDTKKNIIHVMEIEPNGDSSIQRAFCHIQPFVRERIQAFGSSCQNVRWLLYDLEGNVKEYRDGTCASFDLGHVDAHPSFVQKCKMRRLQLVN